MDSDDGFINIEHNTNEEPRNYQPSVQREKTSRADCTLPSVLQIKREENEKLKRLGGNDLELSEMILKHQLYWESREKSSNYYSNISPVAKNNSSLLKGSMVSPAARHLSFDRGHRQD